MLMLLGLTQSAPGEAMWSRSGYFLLKIGFQREPPTHYWCDGLGEAIWLRSGKCQLNIAFHMLTSLGLTQSVPEKAVWS